MRYKAVLASILNPISDKKCDYFADGVMILQNGRVKAIGEREKIKIPIGADILNYSGHVILPGFYDMHFHWVQDDVRLMPKASLLTWLEKYTFPAEMKFGKKAYAKKCAEKFFKRLTKVGTVGGACYSSIHQDALNFAMKEVQGQFIIGNVTMTMGSPEKLTQTRKNALSLVAAALKKYGTRYAFTPRFALATDHETMKAGARLTKKSKAFIQTHLSENHGEINAVMEIYKNTPGFEKVKNYTEVYHKCEVLGPRTIMGHGIHLGKDELGLLSKTKTCVAHCPTSNAPIQQKGLGSGLFNFKMIEKAQIRWALASDIGGGPFLSMFDVMRSFVGQNRKAKVSGATYTKALYRSTLAGAELLGLHKNYGNLNPGKIADFIVVKAPKNILGSKSEIVIDKICNRHKRNRKFYDDMVVAVYLKGIKQ